MLRLLGILSLGNLLFGRHHHHHWCRRHGGLGGGLLLGALLGLFMSRNSENHAEEYDAE